MATFCLDFIKTTLEYSRGLTFLRIDEAEIAVESSQVKSWCVIRHPLPCQINGGFFTAVRKGKSLSYLKKTRMSGEGRGTDRKK